MRELQKREGVEGGRGILARSSKVEVEESLDQLALWMDGMFRIPGVGWRFGLDALVGLIPGVGDTATTLVSLYILGAAVRYRVPKVTLLRMALNLGIDYVAGSVPLVGDLFDAWWKANQKNVTLLRERATVSASEAHAASASDWLFLGIIIICLLALLSGSLVIAYLILRYIAQHIPSAF